MKRLTGIIGMPAVAIMLMGAAFCSHWGGKQPAIARVDRPDKEEVRHIIEARAFPVEEVEEPVAVGQVHARPQAPRPALEAQPVGRPARSLEPAPEGLVGDVLDGAALMGGPGLHLPQEGRVDHQSGSWHASRCTAALGRAQGRHDTVLGAGARFADPATAPVMTVSPTRARASAGGPRDRTGALHGG